MPAPIKINNLSERHPRVLVAPLDWGLGHATRCIPVIKELINQRCEVIVATTGDQKALLRDEFPSLTFIELPGYEIRYDKNRALTILRLMRSIPKILIRIKREKAWLRHFTTLQDLDLVISDNRYGLHIPGVLCIFMTHQLLIRTPWGSWTDRLLQRMNYKIIRHFSRCWIPDEKEDGLAGELSHPKHMPPVTTRYIGWLSRFGSINSPGPDKDYVLILLSGPEPQRTLLEREILHQASALKATLILVRGLPAGGPPLPTLPAEITVHDHLPTQTLEPLISQARLIVARPGYSTLMDLETLGKRALLIPTPGQTEQEYLGAYLAAKGRALCVKQKDFSLQEAIKTTHEQSKTPPPANDLLAAEIKTVLSLL